MSSFNNLIPKIKDISDTYVKNYNELLKDSLESFDKLEEKFQNGRRRKRVTNQKDNIGITTLQSIDEDGCGSSGRGTAESSDERKAPKKRSKNEVEDMWSPGIDKRQKRSASVKAQSIIAKQVNTNLTSKLRREESSENIESNQRKTRRRKDDEKENAVPNVLAIKIKEEKLSLPQEMDMDSIPVPEVKQELNEDGIAMPPPAMPVPKPRKGVAKERSEDSGGEETGMKASRKKPAESMPPPAEPRKVAQEKSEDSADEELSNRKTKGKKPDAMPPPVTGARSTRASNRARQTQSEDTQPLPEAMPKRTRAKKKVFGVSNDADTQSSTANSAVASPAEKPRPKRTRRGKAAEKEPPKPVEPLISSKEERISVPEVSSPILQTNNKSKKGINTLNSITIGTISDLEETRVIVGKTQVIGADVVDNATISDKIVDKDKTVEKDIPDKDTIISKAAGKNKTTFEDNTVEKDKTTVKDKTADKETTVIDSTVDKESIDKTIDTDTTTVVTKDMDNTMVLPNGVYNHVPVTPNNIRAMNETVVLEKCNRETMIIEKPKDTIMDATVVINKGPTNMQDYNSLITDDESDQEKKTPPKKEIPLTQPSSAVKEKVQQFEEMASRVTRTKTRAMAKKENHEETQTPPDKVSSVMLSAETLTKMNNLIFNGKPTQISSSACKPRAAVPVKSTQPSSTSKLSSIGKHREAAEESQRNAEDARRKKEAMLEAKRELQKRKREEKMAAAAAARNAAERERQAALEAAAKERMEKQAHVDGAKLERMREQERKKQEVARKAAETEERRRAEEAARMQRLAEEQRRALALRKKQIEEQEAMKIESAMMRKEIEKRQREYNEKQKKQRLEDKTRPGGYHVSPVYMADGFQFLNSDSDEEGPPRPVPEWSSTKLRLRQLDIQSQLSSVHVNRLFSVGVHSPDLREIFPNIERTRLKRTSSAVWRTPPAQLRTVPQ